MDERNPNRRWLAAAGVNGFLAVALGAFAAHALAQRISERSLAVFEIAVRYQMYHAIALLVSAALMERGRQRAVLAASWCFLIGIVVFCGSLYALALSDVKWLGAITPIGGVAFLAGWLLLAAAAFRRKSTGG